MNKNINRWFFYFLGIIILALGLTLNTKSNLGVSPIISIAYVFSGITGMNFGNATFIWYCVLVVAEYVLLKDWKVVLQIPFSIVFTRFMNLFADMLTFSVDSFPLQVIVLLFGVFCTGVGAALTVDMHIIPNPGDGIVSATAFKIKKELGLTKNIFDFCCLISTILIGFIFSKPFYGVGLGTILAMLCVGRVIAIFNHLFKEKLEKMSE